MLRGPTQSIAAAQGGPQYTGVGKSMHFGSTTNMDSKAVDLICDLDQDQSGTPAKCPDRS